MLPYRQDKADELRSASALGAVDAMSSDQDPGEMLVL